MTRLLEILISTAIVAVLFVLVALFLPSSRTITEQIETNRRQSIVFDTLNSLRRFGDWNALPMRDPGVSMELSGPESGVGARLDYESDERSLGSGSWEIIESDPDTRVLYALETPDLEAVLMTLVDVPLVSPETTRRLIQVWRDTRAPIVRPARGGEHGHPVLFDRRLFPELRAADPATGAKPVVHAHAGELVNVEVDDDGAFFDLDTPADYERALLRLPLT